MMRVLSGMKNRGDQGSNLRFERSKIRFSVDERECRLSWKIAQIKDQNIIWNSKLNSPSSILTPSISPLLITLPFFVHSIVAVGLAVTKQRSSTCNCFSRSAGFGTSARSIRGKAVFTSSNYCPIVQALGGIQKQTQRSEIKDQSPKIKPCLRPQRCSCRAL